MSAYYNEIDKFAAAWLRELIADGLIADGDVDERSILDVPSDDLAGYTQCHFFAGIGGWSRALRLAGWPDDRPVWTGSCPCQPLSSAGQQKGHEDERHIWPAFYGLIAECQPTTVFGEQVGSKLGLEWLAGVRADLESSGYACGAADLPAAGVGAPHIRQRLWWVADNIGERSHAAKSVAGASERLHGSAVAANEGSGVADAKNERRDGRSAQTGRKRQKDQQEQRPDVWGEFGGHGEDSGVADAQGTKQQGAEHQAGRPVGHSTDGRLVDTHSEGLEGYGKNDSEDTRQTFSEHGERASNETWASSKHIPCADGKARRIEPGIFPLADGIPNRVGMLRGAGNAIVPQVASVFVTAFMEII
jgi:DNA (cytosine-5)-methyltransferase 1